MGVSAMLARLGLSIYGGQRLRAACQPVTDRWLLEIVAGQCRRLGLHLVPVVGRCERVAVPVVLGLLKPVILLPTTMLTGLNAEQLAVVLTHELAHIRRYDHLLIIVQRLIEAMLFFHPAVWYLSRCIHRERESCCDDMVLAAGWDRLVYCLSLLRVAELHLAGQQRRDQLAALAVDGEQPSWLRRRIARLLGLADMPAVRLTRTGLVLGLGLLLLLGGGIWISLWPPGKPVPSRVKLVPERRDTFALTRAGMDSLGIRLEAVQPAPLARLNLRGSLALDPNRLAHVHPRLGGEVVGIGYAREPGGDAAQPSSGRLLKFGDRVQKGDLLAVVRSSDLGEKEGELLDSLKRLRIDEENLKYLQEMFRKGSTTEKSVRAAQREVELNEIAVAKAERTLRSWKLTDEEIQKIEAEVGRAKNGNSRLRQEEMLASLSIVSPLDGTIVEKNAVVGELASADFDLFKIADLSVLTAWVRVDEKDIPLLHNLPKPISWTLRLSSNPQAGPIAGTIDFIGAIVDPNQHMALLTGPVDNPDGQLHAGEFITAVIDLPADPSLVVIPASALIDAEEPAAVFVESGGERREFTRRKICLRRRDGNSVFIGREPTDDERDRGFEALHVGERVIVSGVPDLAAELRNAQ